MVLAWKSLISLKDRVIRFLKMLWLEIKWFIEDVIAEIKR